MKRNESNFCCFKDETTLGIGLLLISAALFSVMGSFVHLAANEDDLPPTQLVFMRAIFQGSLIVLAMFQWRVKDVTTTNNNTVRWISVHGVFGDNSKVRNVVIARGMVGSISFICYYHAMSALPLGDAVAVLSLHPIVTVLVAPHILPDEPFRLVHFIAAICSVVGTTWIARPTFLFPSSATSTEQHSNNAMGYAVAVLGSCAASGVILLIRRAGKMKANTLQLLFSWAVFGILMSLFVAAITLSLPSWHWPTSKQAWLYILGLCSFGSVAHFLMNYAGRIAPAGLASIVRSTDIVWSYVMQILIFHAIPSRMTIWGVALIILSLSLLAISKVIIVRNQNKNKKYTTTTTQLLSVVSLDEEVGKEEMTLLKQDNNTIQTIPIQDYNDAPQPTTSSFLFAKTTYGSATSLQPIS
uniref:EamA domain-containing protein n=1 Tax=Eucampia antarctica TaxID=49252 RepID=A0A7S2R0F9_9STRA|mmetsp:Transcript_11869/g.11402  ORF Transcript_11869/g.11402 Transcript_11869/m.11402 type:complete len:413 (+) Transcript_11869:89-1327(+)